MMMNEKILDYLIIQRKYYNSLKLSKLDKIMKKTQRKEKLKKLNELCIISLTVQT
jgi:CobQ-like glutamine amidotransferase family enzyme